METPGGGGGNSLSLYTRPALMGELPFRELCQIPAIALDPTLSKRRQPEKVLRMQMGSVGKSKTKTGQKA